MKLIRINFKIETLEDFHIGTGMDCVGLYSDGQMKDDEGNPALNTETLKGLLRQSCREVKNVLTEYRESYNSIFKYGNLGSLDVSVNYNQDETALNPFVIHTFTKVDDIIEDEDKGALRDIEFGSKGAIFDCSLEFQTLGNNEKEIEGLLKLGIKNLKLFGGLRRRGFGAIKTTIIPNKDKDVKSLDGVTNIKDYRIILELLNNTCIAGAGQTGNIIHTLNYIKGTTALGMFRNVLLKLGSESSIIDHDNIRITNFYPIPKESSAKHEVIPIPLSLRKRKSTNSYKNYYLNKRKKDCYEYEIPHWLLNITPTTMDKKAFPNLVTRNTLTYKSMNSQSDKSFSDEYIVFVDKKMCPENAKVYSPKIELVLRNRITESTQTTEKNAVFTQEMIYKGTRFIGNISFNSIEDAKMFKVIYHDWLNGTYNLHVGRGAQPVKIVEITSVSEDSIQPPKSTDRITITLTSDVILYDDKLNPKTMLKAEDFGLPDSYELIDSKVETELHQSFSGTSGLRRFSEKVIKKGSCFLFESKSDNINITNLVSLGSKGLGFNTNEGFGKFIVNLPVHDFNFTTPEFNATVKSDPKIAIHQIKKLNRINEQFQFIEKLKNSNKGLSEYKSDESSVTFCSKIISYMDSKYDSEKILEEIAHGKTTLNKEKWEKFEKLFNASEFNERNDKYELIRLLFLGIKKRIESKRGQNV